MHETALPDDSWLEQTDRLQTLNEIGRVVSATLDLQTLYETIYEQIGRVMDATQFFIALYRPERDVVELPYHREEGSLFLGQERPYGNSVTSLVIERGAPLLFNTNEEYQGYVRSVGLPELTIGKDLSEAKIWVPLNTGNRTIGAITVQSARPYAYTQDDLQTLSVIASQAAVAIENARLYAQSQNNVLQTRALLNVAQMINGSLELETVLDSILVGMRDVVPYYLAAILLPDRSRGHLDVVGSVGPLSHERRETIKIPFGQGVTGSCYTSGRPLYIPNVYECDYYFSHGVGEIHAEVAVPLQRGDAVIGVLDVEREQVDSFTENDMHLLTLFASQAAIAIENARLYTAQENRVYELQTIQSIVQKLTPLHDIPAIVALINAELKQLIDYHACRIFLLERDTQTLVPVSLTGSEHAGLRLRVGEGLAGWVATKGQPVLVPNSLADVRVTQIAGTPRREESMLAVPLTYQNRVRGVITLARLGVDQFDENALRVLEIIAAQVAIAFDRARLYEELRTEAVTDPLTKLYNRRYLLDRYREERSRAVRNKHTLTAIMLDIDKFKRVNDAYGHDAGDVVLQELARLIRTLVRAEDIVARYGGEEFCILLPEIPLVDAEMVADRLRASIAAHLLPREAGVEHITVSVGMALLTQDDTGQEIFTRADLAMYRVKALGGNRVSVSNADASEFRTIGEIEAAG